MSFLITRSELLAITGLHRTESFVLQKSGQLRVLSKHSQKSWFCLRQTLESNAKLHGLSSPDDVFIETTMNIIINARLSGRVKNIDLAEIA